MIPLCGVHVHKMDAGSAFAAMTHDGTHLQLSANLGFLNSEMNFDFCSDRVLFFAQNTHPNGTQVGQEAG